MPPKKITAKKKSDTADPSIRFASGQDLRRQAEAKLRERRKKAAPSPTTKIDTQRLVHELQVHQIELEMQNEELAQSRAELDAALRQYTDLYDFAPVGYFTLSRNGAIRKANLTGARLFGVERGALIKRRFGLFVSAESRPNFNAVFEKVFAGRGKETGQVALVNARNEPVWVHIEATGSEDGQECHVAVVDITERKRAEESLRASEDRYRGLFGHMVEGYAYCQMIFENGRARDWLYLAVNDAFETLTGLKDVTGKRVTQVIPGIREADPELFDTYTRVALTGKPEKFEMFVKALQIWFSVSVYSPEKEFFVAVFDVITERKRAEERLAYHSLVLDNVSDAVISGDLQFRILSFNRSAEELYGWKAEEALGREFRELLSPDYGERSREQVMEEFFARGKWAGEATHQCKDGSRIQVEVRISLVYDEAGNPTRVVSMIRDITERKRAEDALRESEERFRSAFDNAPNGMALVATNGKFLKVNQFLLDLLGYSEEELLPKTFLDISHPDDIEISKRVLKQLLDGEKQSTHFEKRYIHKDGHTVWILLHTSLYCDPAGTRQYFISHMQDITARKRAEIQLRESESRLEEAQRIAHVGSWEWIAETDTPTWSRELCAILEVDSTKPVPKLAEQHRLYTPDSMDRMNAAVERAMQTGAPYEIELERVRDDGTRRWLLARGERWFEEERHLLVGLRGTALDITARKRAEEEIRRRADQFAALYATSLDITAPHDLPTLLNAIVERTCKLLNAPAGGLYLCDPVKQEARCVVSYNTPRNYIGTVLKYGEGAAGTVAQTGQPLILDDYGAWSGKAKVFADEPLTAIISVPMVWRNQVMGVIHALDDTGMHRFTQTDLELLTLFANQAAIAVENARLLESERAARTRAEILATANAALTQTLDLDRVLDTLLQYLQLLVPYDSTNVMLLENEHILRGRASRGYERWTDAARGREIAFDIQSNAILNEIVSHRHSVLIANTRMHPGWERVPGGEHVLSWIGVPLIVGGRVIGLYSIDKAAPNFFTEEHARLAESLAAQAAVAIQNARLWEAERANRAQLQTLSRKLVETEEMERRRIAQELHDSVGQNLTGLSLNLNIVQSQLSPEIAQKIGTRLDDSLRLIDSTVAKIRDVMANLRPAVLDDYGLVAALRWYADQFASRAGMRVEMRGAELSPRPPIEIETALFRIAQEALTNVVKHARASRVTLGIETINGRVRLTIADDGKGFDPNAPRQPGERAEMGLIGMRERAEGVGGSLRVESEVGKGTRVVVEVGRG